MDKVGDFREVLGEGPVWCDIEQALYWTDIRRRLIRRYSVATGQCVSWEFPESVGSFALRRDGGFVVALESQMAFFDPASGALKTVAIPEAGKSGFRFNDGKCDPAGRFLAGTMQDATHAPIGTLWSLDAYGTCKGLLTGCQIPNGLAWNAEGTRMYFSDTVAGLISTYDYDVDAGTLGPAVPFAAITDGGPDGATIDAEGYYWCAIYGGWRIERYAPNGMLDRSIRLPVQNPTSCCFGDRNLETLYITSASQRLSDVELEAQSLAGAVLRIEVGITGLPSNRFNG